MKVKNLIERLSSYDTDSELTVRVFPSDKNINGRIVDSFNLEDIFSGSDGVYIDIQL